MEKAVEYTLKAEKRDFETVKVCSSSNAFDFARKFYHDDILIYESAFIMLLNRAGYITGYAKISQGGVCGTQVDVKIIAKYAIDSLASGVIFVHNHPSGNLIPSNQDKRFTNLVKKALGLFDINLLDSIIISDSDYYSMAVNGEIL